MFGMGAIVPPYGGDPRQAVGMPRRSRRLRVCALGRRARRAFNSRRRRGIAMKRKVPPAAWILIAMVLGIVVGYMIFTSFPGQEDGGADRRLHLDHRRTCSCA